MAPRPHDADEPVGDLPDEPSGRPSDREPSGAPSDDERGAGDSGGRTPGPDDVEARWTEIVARLGDLGSSAADETDEADDDRPVADPPGTARPAYRGPDRRRPPKEPSEHPAWPADPVEALRGWSPDPEVEEAESHFDPPDPGPVLGGDPMLTMAWAAALGVPILFVLAVLLWQDMPTILMQAAGVLFVAGVGLLVWRMPHGPDDHDRGSGAVV